MPSSERQIDRQVAAIAEVERVARAFHETYQELAPVFGWEPQAAVPWDDLPPANRYLVLATVKRLFEIDAIRPGRAPAPPPEPIHGQTSIDD